MNDIPVPTAENCTCDQMCPSSPDCTCIWIEHLHACIIYCVGGSGPHVLKAKVALDAKVNVTASGTDLAQLAKRLSDVCDAEILVPAARIDDKVALYEKGATIGQILEKVGLLVR